MTRYGNCLWGALRHRWHRGDRLVWRRPRGSPWWAPGHCCVVTPDRLLSSHFQVEKDVSEPIYWLVFVGRYEQRQGHRRAWLDPRTLRPDGS